MGGDGRRALFVTGGMFAECAAIRFRLAGIPRGSAIAGATLTVWHIPDNGYEDETPEVEMTVHTWRSVTVPEFDEQHTHLPHEHDPAGLLGVPLVTHTVATDVATGAEPITFEVAALLQALVERDDWSNDATIGFALDGPKMGDSYDIRIQDSSVPGVGAPARLEGTFIPPP
jgi:hypothetical protein